MSITKQSIHSGIKWSLVDSFAAQFVSLIFFCITARYISKEAFGIAALSILIIDMLRQTLFEATAIIVISEKTLKEEDYISANGFFVVLGFALSLLVYFTSDFISHAMNIPDLSGTLKAMAVMPFFYGLTKAYEAKLARNMQFKTLAIRSLLSSFIGGTVAVTMAMNGFDLKSLIAQQLLGVLVATLYITSQARWHLKLSIRTDEILDLIKRAKGQVVNSILTYVEAQSDPVISTFYLGPAVVAEYNAAKRLILAISIIFSSSLLGVARTTFSALQHDKTQLRAAYLKTLELTTTLTAPIFVGLAVLSADIINLLLGPRWSDVPIVFSILCISAFVSSLLQYKLTLLMIYRKFKLQFWLTMASASINVLLFICFSRYGLNAIASALAIKSLIVFVIYVWIINHYLETGIISVFKKILRPIFAALMMGLLIYSLKTIINISSIINLILLPIFGILIYIGISSIVNKDIVLEVIDSIMNNKKIISAKNIMNDDT